MSPGLILLYQLALPGGPSAADWVVTKSVGRVHGMYELLMKHVCTLYFLGLLLSGQGGHVF